MRQGGRKKSSPGGRVRTRGGKGRHILIRWDDAVERHRHLGVGLGQEGGVKRREGSRLGYINEVGQGEKEEGGIYQ